MGLSSVHEDDAARAVAAVKARREQVRARTVLALFSVSLLWCSSLSAADALVGAVLPTPHRAVSVAAILNETFANVRRAESDYAACADRQSRGCVATLRLSAEAEAGRAAAAEARNNATVRVAQASAETCIQMEATLMRLMRAAQSARAPSHVPWRIANETGSGRTAGGGGGGVGGDGVNSNDENGTSASLSSQPLCGPEDRAAVDAMVSNPGDTLAHASGDVVSAADEFRVGNDAAINRTFDLLLARVDYDASYSANKTRALGRVPDNMRTNMSAAAATLASAVSQSLAALDARAGTALTTTAAEAGSALTRLRDQTMAAVKDYVDTVEVYVSDATSKMAAAGAWFSVFNGLGSVLKLIDIDVTPDVTPPTAPVLDHTAVPGLPPDVTTPGDTLTIAAAARAAAVSRVVDETRVELAKTAALIPEAAVAHLDATGVPTLLHDYDPPPRGGGEGALGNEADGGKAATERLLSEVRSDMKARADTFENQTAAVASLIDAERAAAAGAAEAGATSGQNSTVGIDQASVSAAAAAAAADLKARLGAAAGVGEGVEWLGISPPDVDAAITALAALYAAMDGLVGADLAYRAARSAQHVARHFDHKGHTLPPIDLTAADGNTAARESAAVIVKIAQALGHPACLAAVRAVAASLAATLVSYAYVPFYNVYRRGCVTGCDGTFVTQNMHSIAHNYAAAAGSRQIAAGVARAEGERRDECSRRAPPSAGRLAAARGAMRAAEENRRRVWSTVEGIVRCVDPHGYNDSVSLNDNDPGATREEAAARTAGNTAGGDVRSWGALRSGFTQDNLAELHRLMQSDAWARCTVNNMSIGSGPEYPSHRHGAGTANATIGDGNGDGGGGGGRGGTSGGGGSGNEGNTVGDTYHGFIDPKAEFDCGVLHPCTPTCAGPSRRVLAPLTHISGCAAEGLAHASALRTVLVGLVFFAANAARDGAVRGMAAVNWRALSGGAGYRFEGTLRPDGSAARPDTGGRGVGQVARGKLRHIKRLHVRGGWWALGLAGAAQVPGFVALFAARRSSLVTAVDCTAEIIAAARR